MYGQIKSIAIICIITVLTLLSAHTAAQTSPTEQPPDSTAIAVPDSVQASHEEQESDTAVAAADTAQPRVPRPALFFGIADAAGRQTQPELEQAVRNAFATDGTFRLIDMLETQRIIRERERLGRGGFDNAIPAHFKLDDSTVIIRGIVKESKTDIRRQWLFWGRINARIAVTFYFNDMAGRMEHKDEFSANAGKKKGFIFLSSPKKAIHISATDRMELLSLMHSQIVKAVSESAARKFNPPEPEPEEEIVEETVEETVIEMETEDATGDDTVDEDIAEEEINPVEPEKENGQEMSEN